MIRRLAVVALLLIPIGARGQGVLLLHAGAVVPALDTDVKLRVRGMILRGEVTQRFRNPAPACTEALYAFPLPEDAAVDTVNTDLKPIPFSPM